MAEALSRSAGTFEATVVAVEGLCRRYEAPRVLDVGCGEGDLLLHLAPAIARGCGVDVAPERIAEARRRASDRTHVTFHTGAAEQLPPELPSPFDVIVFVGSLEHMSAPRQALRSAREHAHEDSRIMVVAMAPRAPHAVVSRWLLKGGPNRVVSHLGTEGVREVARDAGLDVEEAPPLYRGSRRTPARRGLSKLLGAYDRCAGPTRAVILRPTEEPSRPLETPNRGWDT